MGEEAKKGLVRGWMKTVFGAGLGLFSGAAAMYATAIFNTVVKPPKPVANFAVTADGLTVTCQNRATGDSGWWDFGDGTPLEPFDAGQPTATHTYAKPGNYSVKLTVRNFIMDENDRSVPVDLSAPPQALAPQVAFRAEPVGPQSVAPATFRITGEVRNAEKALLDLGDKVEVMTETGPFERLVVVEKPGASPIQLTGLSGKQAVKQSVTVNVAAPASGTLSVVLRVVDSGTRIERKDRPQTVAVPAPAKGAKALERPIRPRPGCTIVEAKVGKVSSQAVKNLRVEVAADRKSAKLLGEWAAPNSAEVLVPVTLTEERAVPFQLPPQPVSATFSAGAVSLPLPPQPLGATGLQRRLMLDIRRAADNGRTESLVTVAELKLPWQAQVTRPGVGYGFSAGLKDNQVQLRMAQSGR